MTDRPLAPKGIVDTIQQETGMVHFVCLWAPTLPYELMWAVQAGTRKFRYEWRRSKIAPALAPSWSWLAAEDRIVYDSVSIGTGYILDETWFDASRLEPQVSG
ncbi:hypothetical protein B0H67DRAFT_554574 [Lasiosphaeris hirsuta]|uniref:Uncharacterized protein n=1 Tax=Lasiosphaeris hirsuta TaxID=260670 RepID=A0AA40DUN4_9PEZI|nr:hypothetical protein B0H67DRAFT_554574 [Lasiosphaeris hirsuta]